MDEKQTVSDLINDAISKSVEYWDFADYKESNDFEELISLGELTDRLFQVVGSRTRCILGYGKSATKKMYR